MARVGFDLGASALQCITLTPTPPRICWFDLILYSNNPNPNPNPCLIPKKRVSNAIISGLARIRFSMLRIQVSSENQVVYVVLNFLS